MRILKRGGKDLSTGGNNKTLRRLSSKDREDVCGDGGEEMGASARSEVAPQTYRRARAVHSGGQKA